MAATVLESMTIIIRNRIKYDYIIYDMMLLLITYNIILSGVSEINGRSEQKQST